MATDPEIAIRNLMLADAGVAAHFAERIYPVELAEAPAFPAMVITRAGGVPQYDLSGDTGAANGRFQLDIYAEGQATLLACLAAVRALLSGYTSDHSSQDCEIQGIFVIDEMDLDASEFEKAGPKLRRRMLEIRVWSDSNG